MPLLLEGRFLAQKNAERSGSACNTPTKLFDGCGELTGDRARAAHCLSGDLSLVLRLRHHGALAGLNCVEHSRVHNADLTARSLEDGHVAGAIHVREVPRL